ncbi:MAG TPA: glycosyltransferase family 4 protein [Chloroflexi bacterium]|jgi:glycosyltransferase involved in cell wall biosynthesis|nr:glycosyltransferase family 4 protein [Chloroflexota bacterium]HPO58224.1 glycosyltransferase [Anaerolineaceae bacterium]
MKICIVTTAFPRWPGDFRGPFVYEAAQALRRRGNTVRVIAMHNPGAKSVEDLDGLEVIRPPYLPERWEVLQKDSAGLPLVWKQYPLARLALLPFLLRHTAAVARYANDCDIIHANWTLSAFAALLSQPVHRRPYVVTVQGSDIFQAPRIPLVRPLTRLALNRAARVLALSGSLAQATADLGVPADRIQIMPNGVNIERFPAAAMEDREPIILYAGTLIPRKGADYLIRALPVVVQQCPQARLVLIGEGEMREQLGRLVEQLGLQEKVTFAGTLPQEEVSAWMRRAQIFVLPSLEEGQGVVVLEALASGTPCVGSRAGGISDSITPDVGLLVPPGDSQALAGAMLEILTDREKRLAMSAAARRRAQDVYDWDKIAARIEQVYRQVGA